MMLSLKVNKYLYNRLKPYIFIFIFNIMIMPIIYAQSFNIAFQKYSRGDFKGAEFALKKALKKHNNKYLTAKIYKFLGISQYMLGKKTNAALNFKKALKLNPSIKISSAEVLDESVISYFNKQKIKRSYVRRSLPKVRSSKSSKKIKRTTLFVKTNVNNASIMIDGIIAGRGNFPIETKAGMLTFKVTAPGYIPKLLKMRIFPQRQNTLTINLQKLKPKPRPVKKIARKTSKRKTSKKSLTLRSSKRKHPRLPSPGKTTDLFKDDSDSIDPSMAGRDLAGEFKKDEQFAGVPQRPAVQQTSPYGLQRGALPPQQNPYYYNQPQPGYGYNPYVQQAPSPTYQYQQPYSSSPPPSTYSIGSPPPSYVEPAAPAQTDYYHSSKKSSKRQKKSYKSGNTPMAIFISLLPLGAGQFYNETPILGTLFAGGEIAAGVFWYLYYSDYNTAISNAEKFYADTNATDEEKQQFSIDTATYLDKNQKSQNIAMYSFIGIWVISTLESIINRPPLKRRYSLLENNNFYNNNSVIADKKNTHKLTRKNKYLSSLHLNVLPSTNIKNQSPYWGITFKLKF